MQLTQYNTDDDLGPLKEVETSIHWFSYYKCQLNCHKIFVNPWVCLKIVHTNSYEISYLNLLTQIINDSSIGICNIWLYFLFYTNWDLTLGGAVAMCFGNVSNFYINCLVLKFIIFFLDSKTTNVSYSVGIFKIGQLTSRDKIEFSTLENSKLF